MEKKFGNCRCATKNPKGKWCLSDVRQVVDKLKGNSAFNVISWKELTVEEANAPFDIVTLNHNAGPLREHFNANCNLIRFLALLSPTCPLWRDQGARAVHKNVFKGFPNADISGALVWIPILEKDNLNAALPSVKALNDQRIHHLTSFIIGARARVERLEINNWKFKIIPASHWKSGRLCAFAW